MSRFVREDADGRNLMGAFVMLMMGVVVGMVLITFIRVYEPVPAVSPAVIGAHYDCRQCHANPIPKTYHEYMQQLGRI